jgi:hypothetical protein
MSGPAELDFVIVGAGPAGLQWALLLEEANVSYTILEQGPVAGSFFTVYPRGRRLISHNKCRVGKSRSREFALRHDWHSLLGTNLTMCDFSNEYYPHADEYARYLARVAQGLQVVYEARVERVEHGVGPAELSVVHSSRGTWRCHHVVLATGLAPLPLPPEWASPSELSYSYSDFPAVDPATGRAAYCDNMALSVIGTGNSAFEVTEMLKGCASEVHLLARTPPRFAALAHYPGAVRFKNLGIIDRYMLKSLDSYNHFLSPARKAVDMLHDEANKQRMRERIVSQVRKSFGNITIWCGGWSGERRGLIEDMDNDRRRKYPRYSPFFGVRNTTRAWFAGSLMHGVDWKRSAGGFVHGFRYLVRAQARYVLARDYAIPWPSVTRVESAGAAAQHALSRMQHSSGLYQMQGQLVDVVVAVEENGGANDVGGNVGGGGYFYIEEVPRMWIREALALALPSSLAPRRTWWEVRFEYGKYGDGDGEDWPFNNSLWNLDLVGIRPAVFLHPVCAAVVDGADDDTDVYHAEQDLFAAWSSPIELTYNVHDMFYQCFTGMTFEREARRSFNELFDPISELFEELVDIEDKREREEMQQQQPHKQQRPGGDTAPRPGASGGGMEKRADGNTMPRDEL